MEPPSQPVLLVFSGLPGSGKTTVSRGVAAELEATYLRIDLIEQAIRDPDVLASGIGPSGYAVAQALASANLALGVNVVADCVNPVRASREGWRSVAAVAKARLLEVEVICSDPAEHRRRLETRISDIPGLPRSRGSSSRSSATRLGTGLDTSWTLQNLRRQK